MQIQVNGEARVVSQDVSLPELLDSLAIPPDRVAIELNEQVIRRAEWPLAVLREGDKIEIVYFVGGGTNTEPRDKETCRQLLQHPRIS